MKLRSIAANAGQSLALFAMGTLVVAGCVTAVSYSRAAHLSAAPAGALLVLGAVAVAGQGAASVHQRRHELALAELRGRRGLRLLAAAMGEPTAILVVATFVGTALGWAVARVCVHRLIRPDAVATLTGQEWLAAGVVLLAAVGVTVAVSWRTTFQPLSAKLDDLDRPRWTSAVGLFLTLLVLLGAVVSVYQARDLGVRHANWVSFLSPALVGLAAGQVGTWAVAVASHLAMRSPRLDRRLGWFLMLRRSTRRTGSVAVIRLVVAAVVVAGIAGSAWIGSVTWRDQTARIEAAGPVAFPVRAGGLQAYVASHLADPQGQWLMAMSASPSPSADSDRGVFVDTARWDRVVGPFFTGTPVASISTAVSLIVTDAVVRPLQGTRFAISFTAASVRRTWPAARIKRVEGSPLAYGFSPLQFTIRYVDDEGDTQVLRVPNEDVQRPTSVRRGVVGYSARIAGCQRACALQGVAVRGLTQHGSLHVTEMSFAGLRLLPVSEHGPAPVPTTARLTAVASRGDLRLRTTDPYTDQPLFAWRAEEPPAALVTPGLDVEKERAQTLARGLDGESRPIRVSGEVPALPLLGRVGLLLDLGTALRGAGGQIPTTQSLVVARADTPAAVLDALVSTGVVGTKQTVEQKLTEIQNSEIAQGTQLYALIAGFGLSIAAVTLVAAVAEQRRQRRSEAAAFRVVGLSAAQVSASYRAEAVGLGAATTVVAAIAVWAGGHALLGVIPLVEPGQFGLPFDARPDPGLLVGLTVASGAVVAVTLFLGLRAIGRSSPPSILRDDT